MNWQAILTGAWQVLNSPPALLLLGAALAWLLGRLFAARPAWQRYEGTIISAIKYAEKAIPDNTPNKGAARLDEALRYVLAVYGQTHRGQEPSAGLTDLLREGVQIIHDRIEANGTLK